VNVTTETEAYYFPNKMGRIVLLSLEEVMGVNGLNAVLNLARLQAFSGNYPPADFEMAFRFADMARLWQAIDEMYGPRGGRGLAIRAGRACFRHGVQDFGGLLGIADVALRLIPLSWKLRLGLQVLAEIFNHYSDQQISLEETDDAHLWISHRCGLCWERRTSHLACGLMIGLLDETCYWLSGGKHFDVEELTCVARGDATCTLQLSKQPLG